VNTTSIDHPTGAASCVFVVDDDEALRRLLVETLAKAGLVARAYASADDFIADFDPRLTGCLVLDLNLPGTSGLELQRWLAPRGGHLPIVFLTANADGPTADEAMRAGAIDCLQKPVDRDVLLERVGIALELEQRLRPVHSNVAVNRRKIALLSKRELEICELLIEGLASKEIARKLAISTRTVEHHRANVLHKVEAANVVELVRIFLSVRDSVAPPR
jgi:FixJ family two-component response regulator